MNFEIPQNHQLKQYISPIIPEEKICQLFSQNNIFTTSDKPQRKCHLIVDEYDGETLSHDETKNIRKLFICSSFVS